MLSLLLLATIVVGEPGGKLDLTPRFQEGETFFLLEKNRIAQQFQAEDVRTKTVWTERRLSRFQVLQANKDSVVLEQTLLQVEAGADEKALSILSVSTLGLLASPPGQGPFLAASTLIAGRSADGNTRVPKGLAGAVLKWTIDLKERKLRGEGYEDLVARVAKESGIEGKLVRQALPADVLESGVFTLVGLTPRQPVSKGETWTTRLAPSLGAYGGLSLETKFHIKDVRSKKFLEAVGSVKPEYVPPPPGKERSFQVQSAQLSKDKGQCKLLFSLEQGRVQKSELSLAFTLALQLMVNNRSVAVTITQERSTLVEVLAKEPQP